MGDERQAVDPVRAAVAAQRAASRPALGDADKVLANRERLRDALSPDGMMDGAQPDEAIHHPESRASKGPTGVGYVDNGAVCSTDPSHQGCLLTEVQRSRLMDLYPARVARAQAKFDVAITDMKFETLMQKSDDPSWIAILVLDLASTFLVASVASGIKAFKAMSAANAANRVPLGLSATVANTLSEKQIEAAVGGAVGQGKRLAAAYLNAGAKLQVTEEQKTVVPFLEAIRRGADPGFQYFAAELPSSGSDNDLVAAFLGFEESRHTVELYRAAIADKIGRYKASGIDDIGKVKNEAIGSAHHLEDRMTRVLWANFTSGAPRQLMLESQYGPMPERMLDRNVFGFKNPTGPSELRVVPKEFEAIAIARHVQAWLEPPTSFVVDDSWLQPPARHAGKTPQPATGIATGAAQSTAGHTALASAASGSSGAVPAPTAQTQSPMTQDQGASPIPSAPWGGKSILPDTPR